MNAIIARVRQMLDGWSEAGRDVLAGARAVASNGLMLVGAIALVGCGVLAGVPQARQSLAEVFPRDPALEENRVLETLMPAPAQAAANPRRTDADAGVAFGRPQQSVTTYLARRYKVAEGAVKQLVTASYAAGTEQGVDPLLILAVMAVESSMNPFAESAVGAQGLMQVMTQIHAEKFEPHGGDGAALDPIANIDVGTTILADLIRRSGSVERGLQLYVGAGNLPNDGGYAARVLAERGRLTIAARGDVNGALLAGLRADALRASMPAATSSAADRLGDGAAARRPPA